MQGTCRQCREHRASIRSESAGIHPARRTGLRRADKTSDAMRDLVVSPAMGVTVHVGARCGVGARIAPPFMEATDTSRLVCVVVVSYQEYSLSHTRVWRKKNGRKKNFVCFPRTTRCTGLVCVCVCFKPHTQRYTKEEAGFVKAETQAGFLPSSCPRVLFFLSRNAKKPCG